MKADDKEVEVQDPFGLIGVNYLWDIVLDSVQLDVVRDSMDFLIRLHTRVSPQWIQSFGQLKIREEFIRQTMVQI
jgi:hypothetical protein